MNTVAIVEDNAVMRKTFRQWIDAAPGFRCVFACATAEEAVAEIPGSSRTLCSWMFICPGNRASPARPGLKEALPTVQVIIVTVYRNHELIFQALQAGACGYLLKRSSPEELLKAINEVLSGGAPMTSEIARMLVEAFQKKPASLASSDGLTSVNPRSSPCSQRA